MATTTADGWKVVPAAAKKPRWMRLVGWIIKTTLSTVGLLLLWLVGKPSAWAAEKAAKGLADAAKAATVGKHRAMWAPAWMAAAVSIPAPYAGWVWLTAAVLLDAATFVPSRSTWAPWLRRPAPSRKFLSHRERALVRRACATAVAWHYLTGWIPWWGSAVLLAALTVGFARPWWQGRRIRPTEIPPLVEIWDQYAVPGHPEGAGKWRDVESLGDRDTGILRLDSGKPADLAQKDAEITCTIDRDAPFDLPAGALDISLDAKLPSARDVRVTLMRDPAAARKRIMYFDGPTLKDGAFVAGHTVDGRPIHGRLYRSGSANNNLLLGGPGSGKGGGTRTIAFESAMAERELPDGTLDGLCYRVGIDGKRGAGIPELADTFDHYGRTEEEWDILLRMSWAILDSRLTRYGELGQSRWSPAKDPLYRLTIDEIFAVAKRYPRHAGKAEQYAAQGRSLGLAIDANTQRGGGDDMWSTTFRANLRGNGTISIGKQGDSIVGMLATQDTMVDLTKLPKAPGYMFMVSHVEEDIPLVPFRYRYSVSREEHEEGTPLGPDGSTVEDWAVSPLIRWATLHEQDLEAIAPWVERLGGKADDTPAMPAGTADDGDDQTPWYVQYDPARQDEDVTPPSTLDATHAVLPEVGTITAEQVAEQIGKTPRTARTALGKLRDENPPRAEKVGPNAWRKAS